MTGRSTVRDEVLSPGAILDAARAQVRRYGEAKTNVVDIARALGTSHTSIYRHFGSKAEIFDALVQAAMRDEEELARNVVQGDAPASDRLLGLVLALHRRKRERFRDDPEVYGLYRRVVVERSEIIERYAEAMTALIAAILADGRRQGEFRIDDPAAAAEVVRDAVTVYVHPALVAAGVMAADMETERALRRTITTLVAAFRAGVTFVTP